MRLCVSAVQSVSTKKARAPDASGGGLRSDTAVIWGKHWQISPASAPRDFFSSSHGYRSVGHCDGQYTCVPLRVKRAEKDFLRQKAEGRRQKAEGRRQKAEGRRQKA